MSESFDYLSGLSGFLVGFFTIAIVFYFVKKNGKKKRLFDERYHQIHNKARSIAWGISTLCIAGAWITAMIIEGAGFSFFLLTFVYVAHMIAYVIGGIIAEKKF
ncbi:DUF3796 domain-containing protein [Paenisporosarcina indica]|uniref:DUF3796 domain-containing protein n=1 Tax=Paenisporosarcina indica TaxID=650093 RepID=UPI00094FD0DA|nr:DUF3796 domain-containing protein [Paenisporosarcina indica]